MKHRRLPHTTAALAALAIAAAAIVAATGPAHAAATAATTLVVDANRPFRAVTHVAAGGLYGLDTATVPADSLVEPLHPNTFVQMAPGGRQLPNGEPVPGGDALVVAPEAARAGAKVVVRMPDWYPNFPYHWVSWSNWLSAVDTQIGAVRSSGATDISAWELWNEPDFTWNTSAAGAFDAGWARTFKEVRAKDGTRRPIQGPSFTHFSSSLFTPFLTDAKASGTLPDIVSWHELGGAAGVAADVAAYRSLEASLGISPRPIAIEEYGTRSEVGVPGALVGYIAKFERAGVNNAELAFWNHYGALGDTLVDTGGAPNGAYWLYAWYGAMTGNMVTTVPPAQTGIDGAASVTADGRQISVIAGGGTGANAVTVNGLGSLPAFGRTVHVRLEHVPSLGRTTPVPGPSVISQSDVPVTNGSVTVPITMNPADGYHLVITPSAAQTPAAVAFPGAVGFGAGATGGAGGPTVHVTNLNDSGAGSFRDAVGTGHRIVEFDVSGYVRLSSPVSVASDLTIDGTTAPGPGIGIMAREVSFSGSSNDIVRDIRFRQGDLDPDTGKSGINLHDAGDMVFDHVSVEFGQFDNVDSVGAKDITVQNSIIADPIGQRFAAHTETGPYTWYHDVFANDHNRNPLAKADTQFINNVVYDYQAGYTAGNSSGHFSHDVIGNYFIAGPVTTSPSNAYFQMSNQSVFNSGNDIDATTDGVLNGQPLAISGGATALSAPWSPTTAGIPTSSAAGAYQFVVANAGAQPRDQVDSQVITNVTSLGRAGSLWSSQQATGLANDGYGDL